MLKQNLYLQLTKTITNSKIYFKQKLSKKKKKKRFYEVTIV